MAEVALTAAVRHAQGSSNSRRLRAQGKIPAVVYGHGVEPTSVEVEARALRAALNTKAGINALLRLDIEGSNHLALAREIQVHPVRGTVAHLDFQVVDPNQQITATVPLHFVGEATKVTKMGGAVEQVKKTLGIAATPSTLPAHIEVDLSGLEMETTMRVKDIVLPDGVTVTTNPDEPVAVGKATRGSRLAGAEGEA